MRTRAPRADRVYGTAIALAATWLASLAIGCGDGAQRPHVVMIVVDTLRADHLAAYGSTRELTPRIDALASIDDRDFDAYRAWLEQVTPPDME